MWGCALIGLAFGALMYTIFALIGLITGTLDLPGDEGDLIIHKPWGRILSAAILLAIGWFVLAIRRVGRGRKRHS
jgi:hypothetical protein